MCGDLESALKYAKKALSLTPNNPNWLSTQIIVSTLYKMERYEEIIKATEKNIHASDMSNIILAIYSAVEYELGNEKEAKSTFERLKSSVIDKEEINEWFPEGDIGERLIASLVNFGSLN